MLCLGDQDENVDCIEVIGDLCAFGSDGIGDSKGIVIEMYWRSQCIVIAARLCCTERSQKHMGNQRHWIHNTISNTISITISNRSRNTRHDLTSAFVFYNLFFYIFDDG